MSTRLTNVNIWKKFTRLLKLREIYLLRLPWDVLCFVPCRGCAVCWPLLRDNYSWSCEIYRGGEWLFGSCFYVYWTSMGFVDFINCLAKFDLKGGVFPWALAASCVAESIASAALRAASSRACNSNSLASTASSLMSSISSSSSSSFSRFTSYHPAWSVVFSASLFCIPFRALPRSELKNLALARIFFLSFCVRDRLR